MKKYFISTVIGVVYSEAKHFNPLKADEFLKTHITEGKIYQIRNPLGYFLLATSLTVYIAQYDIYQVIPHGVLGRHNEYYERCNKIQILKKIK